jgi:hypothetical protein
MMEDITNGNQYDKCIHNAHLIYVIVLHYIINKKNDFVSHQILECSFVAKKLYCTGCGEYLLLCGTNVLHLYG